MASIRQLPIVFVETVHIHRILIFSKIKNISSGIFFGNVRKKMITIGEMA